MNKDLLAHYLNMYIAKALHYLPVNNNQNKGELLQTVLSLVHVARGMDIIYYALQGSIVGVSTNLYTI